MRYLTVFVLLFAGCSSCTSSDDKEIAITPYGTSVNGIESGHWEYHDAKGRIIEEGKFDAGIRTGWWRYATPVRDSIFWNKYEGGFRTNVPDFFHLVEEHDSLIHFKYKDTAKIFDLIIGRRSSNPFNDFRDYQSQLYRELQDLQLEIGDTTTEIIQTTSNLKYLHTKIWGRLNKDRIIRIYSIVLFDKDSTMAEVTVRSDKEFADKARIVFFSVISNIFYDSKRFIAKEDQILEWPN